MSYPVTLSEEDFELFRLVRLLGKQKTLELLKTVYSKKFAIDDLLSVVKGEERVEKKELNKEALSFILHFIREKFPEVEIPPKFSAYIPVIQTIEKVKETKRKVTERAKKGEITPQTSYTLPILESLIEMGGSGRMNDVLTKVLEKMREQLKPIDFQKVPSGTSIRWKNAAQWVRQRLVTEGYLKKDSPRGIWEITSDGRKLYERLKEKV